MMQELANELNAQYGTDRISVEIKDQYFNMREKIEPVMHIVSIAEKRWKKQGETIIKPIRGEPMDLNCFMGLLCLIFLLGT